LYSTFPEEEFRIAFMRKNYIPCDIELDFSNFVEFTAKRKELLKAKFREILCA